MGMNGVVLIAALALGFGPQDVGQSLSQAQRLAQDHRLEEAWAAYTQLLQRNPTHVDALVGSAFTALRLGKVEEALSRFDKVLTLAPGYADAFYGKALCLERLNQLDQAAIFAKKAVSLEPGREEFRSAADRLVMEVPPPPRRPARLQLDFKVDAQGFYLRHKGNWQRVYLKGVNLGAALPGKFPSEFPEKKVYQGWLRDMAEMNVNVLRVYTLHPPAFYEALREHNLASTRPIYLLHGVWVEPPPGDDFNNKAWYQAYFEDMRRTVDVLHGRAAFRPRPGSAGGRYMADVSPWWLGTILGREWEPFNVVAFNRRHPGTQDWKGRFVEVKGAEAIEVFMAKAMDDFIALEHDTYHAQRPTAFTNWPTLDPLHHPTETSFLEEQQLRKKLGLPYVEKAKVEVFDDDCVAIDMEKFSALPALQAGLYASYHVYPNYPAFINLDPEYAKAQDAEGPNSYLGYLRDLKRHHQSHAVVVSEFGMSNSRSPAHWQPQGMTHGGHSEKAQAHTLKRLIHNIHAAGCAGGIVFAWMDEWFKKTWQMAPLEVPPERNPLWFNWMDAEQNYGITGHHPGAGGPSILIDGRAEDWKQVPVHQSGQGLALKLLADEGWLHVGLFWEGDKPNWRKEAFVLGLDTYDPKAGNRQLPFELPLKSPVGLEFVVEMSGEKCAVWVDEPYAFAPHRYFTPRRTLPHEGGPWVQMETETNRMRIGRDMKIYPPRRYTIGELRRGNRDRQSPDFDSLGEWMEGPSFLELSIPWSLLQVTDPSSRSVLQDEPGIVAQEHHGSVVTEGFRTVLIQYRKGSPPRVLRTLPPLENGLIPPSSVFTWATWQQPRWHAFRKQAFEAVREAYGALPEPFTGDSK